MSLEQFNQITKKEEGNRREERKQLELLQEAKTWTKEKLSSLKAEILSAPKKEQILNSWNKKEMQKSRTFEQEKTGKSKEINENKALETWIKGNFLDFQANLEQGSKENTDLRMERNLGLKINKGIIQLSSYNNSVNFNPKTGQVYVGNQALPQKFLLGKEKEEGKILMNSEYNAKKMKAIFGVMNIINRALQLGSTISKKSADNFAPYHIDKSLIRSGGFTWNDGDLDFNNIFKQRIEIENGFRDTTVLKVSSLKTYAEALGMQDEELAKMLVNYLNSVHKQRYGQQTNQARTINGYQI